MSDASAGSVYRAVQIEKRYGVATALHASDFEVRAGEIHALVGANGAGKSTLMKILAGIERPTSGTIELDGVEVDFSNPADAEKLGVAIVSQELSVFPTLDVLHNLFVPREPRRWGLVSRRRMRSQAEQALAAVGLQVPLDRAVEHLRLADQQLLEIARALIKQPRFLILDEPTSALNGNETLRLLEVARQLRRSGTGIIFVSHFLADVMALADVVTVLCDGAVVCDRAGCAETDVATLVRHMLGGREAPELGSGPRARHASRGRADEEAPLQMRDVSVGQRLRGVSLDAWPGEVVGLAGLDGSGVETVFSVLFGRSHVDGGEVRMPDGGGAPRSTRSAVMRGVAYVPADRRRFGLLGPKPVWENVGLVRLTRTRRWPCVVRRGELMRRAESRGAEVNLRMASPNMPVEQLSGGNQQKVVFAKWLDADPLMLLLDDPTRGVDIGARADMHRIIRQATEGGLVTLFTSSDLEEYVLLCDRVIVFYRGQCIGELRGDHVQQESLLGMVNAGGTGERQDLAATALPSP